VGRGEERGQGAALRDAEQRGPLDPDRVHDRPQVVHALVKARELADPVREAGAALVEHHDPREAREAKEPAGEVRLVPLVLEVRHEAGGIDQVDRTVAEDLIGDVNVAALGVSGSRQHVAPPVTCGQPTIPARGFDQSTIGLFFERRM
jgi:hypothetical protein